MRWENGGGGGGGGGGEGGVVDNDTQMVARVTAQQ